jgi:hypothetical protein
MLRTWEVETGQTCVPDTTVLPMPTLEGGVIRPPPPNPDEFQRLQPRCLEMQSPHLQTGSNPQGLVSDPVLTRAPWEAGSWGKLE